jgi:hypothetical protein
MEKELVKRTVNSLEFFLNPKIFGNGELEREINDRLMSVGNPNGVASFSGVARIDTFHRAIGGNYLSWTANCA